MFVGSSSVSVSGSGTVPVPQIVDVSTSGTNGARHSHVQVTGVVSSGGLTMTFDAAVAPAFIIAGIGNVIIPVPPSALNLVVVASTGGMGQVSFGRSK